MQRLILVLIILVLMLVVCPVASRAADPGLPFFTDVTEQAGIQFKHSIGDFKLSNIVEGTGAGVLVFDFDNDGWMDLYFVTGRWHPDVSDNYGRQLKGKLSNRLYRNNRDGTFTDVTDKAGVGGREFSCGASAADIDNDGDLDLYVLNYGPNELFLNNGDGTFTEISQKSGLADARWSLQAAWFDYNGDGWLDVYVVNYLEYDKGVFRAYYAAQNYPGPLSYPGQPDALFRNNGNGTFTEVTREAGVWNAEGRGMGVTVLDFDNDGLPDIYVTNDAMPNDLFRNLGGHKFREEALVREAAFGEAGQGVSSMGPTFADVDHDGWLDLYIPDMDYGCLLINRRDHFEDKTTVTGLAVMCGQYTGWGGLFLDYDNDGWADLFIANGNAHNEYPEDPVLARNEGQGKFVDVAARSGDYFHHKYVARGAAWADIDNDGDIDVIVINLNAPPKLLRNDGGNRNHWLMVRPMTLGGKRDALGARVGVHAGGMVQIMDHCPTRSYLSQGDPRLHFGLGAASKADRVEIRWPDGTQTVLADVPTNQILTIVQPSK